MNDHLSPREKELAEALMTYLRETQHDFLDENRVAKSFASQLRAEENPEFVESLCSRIGDLAGARVLEIGSGSGWRAMALARAGATVTGLELLESGVRAAELRAHRHPNLAVEFQQGRAESLPFEDRRFDAVLSFQVIEHVEDIDRCLTEMFRVLEPGGFVYLETGNSLYPREEHYRIFWPPFMPKAVARLYARLRGKNPIHVDHVHFIHRGAMLERMKRAGFSSTRDLYVDFVRERCANYGEIAHPMLRAILATSSLLSLNLLIAATLARVGLYPGLFLWGKRPVGPYGN
jgi:ubiquinone/menaquinone biosynthesis C-methylase UbiE